MTTSPGGRARPIVTWVATLVAAGILGMASMMKLSGNADSVALFTTLGAEPWGRFLVGLAELTAVVLLLWPKRALAGGALAVVLMIGAVGAHLTKLGIAYNGDPSLFVMAVMVLAAGITVVLLRRTPATA